MISVLFVCLGNICRSPMAEAVFRNRVAKAGLETEFTVDSAGTGGWHLGEPPHEGTQRILNSLGIAHYHRSRLITPADLERFDYVVVMDQDNYDDVMQIGIPKGRIVRMLDYLPNQARRDVPDPYSTGKYQLVYDLVSDASDQLLAAIQNDHNLGATKSADRQSAMEP